MTESIPTTIRFVRVMTGIVGGLMLISCLAGIGAGMANSPKPAWFFVMFEVLGLLPSIFAILFAFGRLRNSPTMTLTCIAGSIMVVAVLGGFSIQWNVAGFGLKAFEAVRALAACALGLIAVFMAIDGDRQRWGSFVKGAVFGIGFVLVAGLGWKLVGPGSVGAGMPGGLRLALVAFAYLLATGLLAASVQILVRAFTSIK